MIQLTRVDGGKINLNPKFITVIQVEKVQTNMIECQADKTLKPDFVDYTSVHLTKSAVHVLESCDSVIDKMLEFDQWHAAVMEHSRLNLKLDPKTSQAELKAC